MPSSPPNNSGQCDVTTTPLSAQKTLNLDKTPLIPLKDTLTKKTKQTVVINKYKLKIMFIVGKNQDVKPREKFATLLSLLIRRFPAITLKKWDCSEDKHAQSITAASNLPNKKKHLEKYCPHDRNKSCLSTQWKIRLPQATFYEIKNDPSVIPHLE
eukprot:5311029-Ditylum_brightwellii.AAC.1